jgi:hypothetical protein
LKRVPLALAGQTAKGDTVQLSMDERNQPGEGTLVAFSPFKE